MAGRVDVDTSDFDRGLKRLASNFRDLVPVGVRTQAELTARNIAGNVPVRTGRLRATVGVRTETAGTAVVTYGGGLPYANYIEHRTQAVENGTSDAESAFVLAMTAIARKATSNL